MPKISGAKLKAVEVPLPPLDEQRRIAAILDKADAVRRKRREAIALTEDLLRSTFLDMFGDPVTNPKGWETEPLKGFCTITTGNTPSRAESKNYGQFIEWVKTDNISEESVTVAPASESLSELGFRRSRHVEAGAVLMACIAGSLSSIGKVAIADRPVAFNQQINALTPTQERVTTEFLYVLLKFGQRRVQDISTGGMKGLVSKGRLSTLRLMLPPMARQRSFTPVFEQYRSLRRKLGAAEAAEFDLFHSLVQRAFRGDL